MKLLAHLHSSGATGFLAGLSHPVSGFDHVLAMIAVGLWGSQLGPPAVWALPVAFPLAMALGGMLGLLGLPLPGVDLGIALSACILGALVLLAARPPLGLGAIVVGTFALFHGHSHGTELPPGENGTLYSIGFVVATGLLHAAGIGLGAAQHFPWGPFAIRAGGALILAGGGFFLWRALA